MQQRLAHPVTAALGLTKHQNLAPVHFLFKQFSQPGVLLILLKEDELLCNPVIGFQLSGADNNPVGIPQEIRTNGLNLFGPGGTPQQRLSVWSYLHTSTTIHTTKKGRP